MDPVECLKDDASVIVRTGVEDLFKEWNVMYDMDRAKKEKYASTLLSHLKQFFADILETEVKKKEGMIERIEKCLKEHNQLQMELHMTIEQHYNMNDPLQGIIESLDSDLQRYRDIKKDRLSKLEELRQKESVVCEILDAEPFQLHADVPSSDDLMNLKAYIRQLSALKIDREHILMENREKVLNMMASLETQPMTSFEKDVCERSEVVQLSEKNLKQLEELVESYEQRVAVASERIAHKEAQLEKLWARIRIPEEEQIEFKTTYSGIGPSAVETLSAEIERCEELKRINMKSVIGILRSDIGVIWDKMRYTPEQRMSFSAFFTETFNEDVLELHELELQQLQDYYDKYQDIFHLAEKREILLEKMEDLAASAKDPNRYKNRGGQLLREEKERKSTEVNLAKTTNELKKLLADYLDETGQPFLWGGEHLLYTLNQATRPAPSVKTPRAKENKPAVKRKAARVQPDQTFTVPTPSIASSSIDSGINMKQLSSDSLSSYTQFQEHVDAGSSPAKRACMGNMRTPRRSPVKTPRTKTPRTPGRIPRFQY